MQILKAFFKIAGKLKFSLVIPFVIFISICSVLSGNAFGNESSFEQSKLKVVIFDEDNTSESKALYDFIADNHNIVEMENDTEKLSDSLYYRDVDYVLTIEDGYSEKLKNGETENLFTYSVDPKTYSSEYINMQIRQYVSTIGLYLRSGEEFADAQADTIETLSNDTTVTSHDFSEKTTNESSEKLFIFMRFIAYVLPYIMINVLSRIIIELRSESMKNRTFCSPITPFKYNGQIILGSIIFSVVMWIVVVAVSFVFGGSVELNERIILAVTNSFVFMLVSTGIAVLISMCFSKNGFAIDMISNIICLGMAFLCGVFVDQSLLGEKVLSVGRFLPAYWYIRAIDTIGQVGGNVFNASAVWQFMGVEVLFAAALFAISLVVARYKKA